MYRRNKESRRNFSPLNLSFLDIMSCGLGAVVLIFLLIKHNVDKKDSDIENNILKDTIALNQVSEGFNQEKNILGQNLVNNLSEINKLRTEIEKIIEETAKLRKQNNIAKSYNADLEVEIKKKKKQNTNNIVELKGKSYRNYLTGMPVKGKRIIIALDSSASMTEEKLIDIIRAKIGSNSDKINGKKWQRAIRASSWFLARLPEESSFQFLTYNDEVNYITPQKEWHSSKDIKVVSNLISSINNLIPIKGTNIENLFKEINKLNPPATDIYLITDGLPTLSNFAQKQGRCEKKNTVSTYCREIYFNRAKRNFLKNSPNTSFNSIILPMEGDNTAFFNFWNLSMSTGGVILSPSKDWP
tara:strand:+ start:2060 stop:3130 length:1071 start_codon:yes stop_codon:yes gene_type:complete